MALSDLWVETEGVGRDKVRSRETTEEAALQPRGEVKQFVLGHPRGDMRRVH